MTKKDDEKIAMSNFIATVKHYLQRDHGFNATSYDKRIEYLYESGKTLSDTIKTILKEKSRKKFWKS